MAQTAKAKAEGFAVLAAIEDSVTAMVRHPGEVKNGWYHGARVSAVVPVRRALRKRLRV